MTTPRDEDWHAIRAACPDASVSELLDLLGDVDEDDRRFDLHRELEREGR